MIEKVKVLFHRKKVLHSKNKADVYSDGTGVVVVVVVVVEVVVVGANR